MTPYIQIVLNANTEAEHGEAYVPIPGEPTMVVGETTWFLVGMLDNTGSLSENWLKDLGRNSPGASVGGGWLAEEIGEVINESEGIR